MGRENPKEAGIETSMGSTGSALDNAVVESSFSTLRRELVNRYSLPTKSEARVAVFEVDPGVLHRTLGHWMAQPLRRLSCRARLGTNRRTHDRMGAEAAMARPRYRGKLWPAQAFSYGRGWFRTSDLSRVKRALSH
jgi:transposase InsO family protein